MLLVAKDPEDEERRVLAPVKCNLSQPAPALAGCGGRAGRGSGPQEILGDT